MRNTIAQYGGNVEVKGKSSVVRTTFATLQSLYICPPHKTLLLFAIANSNLLLFNSGAIERAPMSTPADRVPPATVLVLPSTDKVSPAKDQIPGGTAGAGDVAFWGLLFLFLSAESMRRHTSLWFLFVVSASWVMPTKD